MNKANENKVTSTTRLAETERLVADHMGSILDALEIALDDPNVADTPRRYAKMLVQEVCRGRFAPAPKLTTFPNTQQLDELIISGPLSVRSLCSHHFCPIIGQAWIGILPGDRLAGLSKFSRILDWFAARPQMQEELTLQVADYLGEKLAAKGIAVVIKASHTCMTWRGVRECPEALMTTSVMRGVFRTKPEARAEFLALIRG